LSRRAGFPRDTTDETSNATRDIPTQSLGRTILFEEYAIPIAVLTCGVLAALIFIFVGAW
jgi:hypothetical protein